MTDFNSKAGTANDSVLTADMLTAFSWKKDVILAPIGAMNIVVTEYALKDTAERLFPASRHRSKRIHKKLVKRHGGEFRKVPCAFETSQGLIIHPVVYEQLKQRLALRMDTALQHSILGKPML